MFAVPCRFTEVSSNQVQTCCHSISPEIAGALTLSCQFQQGTKEDKPNRAAYASPSVPSALQGCFARARHPRVLMDKCVGEKQTFTVPSGKACTKKDFWFHVPFKYLLAVPLLQQSQDFTPCFQSMILNRQINVIRTVGSGFTSL